MPKLIRYKDIANHLGISKMTVSRALRGQPGVAKATRESIVKAAEEMGYQSNPLVSAFLANRNAPQKANANVACLHSIMNPAVEDFLKGAQESAAQSGFALDTFALNKNAMSSLRFEKMLQARGVSGLIYAFCRKNELPLDYSKFTCVRFGYTNFSPEENMPYTTVDEGLLRLSAFKRLLTKGYRRIGFVEFWRDSLKRDFRRSAREKASLMGMPEVLKTHPAWEGGTIDSLPVCLLDNKGKIEDFITWFYKYQPDVIVSKMPFPLINALQKENIHVPEQVGVVSLEVSAPEDEFITGYRISFREIGNATFELLKEQLLNNVKGLVDMPKGVHLGGKWLDAKTLKA